MSHPSIRELPAENRPYEKFIRFGAQALSDAELLAILIRSGTGTQSVLEVAQNVISAGGNSLAGIETLGVQELMRIPGIGEVKAVQLKCICELAGRAAKARLFSRVHLNSPDSIAAYYMDSMRYLQQEHIVAAMFDSSLMLTGDRTVSVGSVNAAYITPREIYRKALEADAVSLVLLHNHPSGDPTPSDEDISFTSRVAAAGNMIGIPLMDHIVIGNGVYTSLRRQGFLDPP